MKSIFCGWCYDMCIYYRFSTESIGMLENSYNGIINCLLSFSFIMMGMIIFNLIENKVSTSTKDIPLYKVGIISMLTIMLHNVFEYCTHYTL